MSLLAAENWTNSAQGASIEFRTTPVGSTSTATVMSIGPDGNVGINMPLDVNGNATAALDRLQVSGDLRVGTSGTNGCLRDFNGNSIAGICSSDRRLKKDITPFGPVLKKFTALQPVHYFWRTVDYPERHFGTSQAAGLIAQDVEQVLPELVETDPIGFKAVNYSLLPLFTIQAVKELKAESDDLTKRVAELERRVNELLANRGGPSHAVGTGSSRSGGTKDHSPDRRPKGGDTRPTDSDFRDRLPCYADVRARNSGCRPKTACSQRVAVDGTTGPRTSPIAPIDCLRGSVR
jgi:hypothetical protein